MSKNRGNHNMLFLRGFNKIFIEISTLRLSVPFCCGSPLETKGTGGMRSLLVCHFCDAVIPLFRNRFLQKN